MLSASKESACLHYTPIQAYLGATGLKINVGGPSRPVNG